jgi:hypothetical protein
MKKASKTDSLFIPHKDEPEMPWGYASFYTSIILVVSLLAWESPNGGITSALCLIAFLIARHADTTVHNLNKLRRSIDSRLPNMEYEDPAP